MQKKIIALAMFVIFALLVVILSQTSNKPEPKVSPEAGLKELISRGMLEDPGSDTYTPIEIFAVLEPETNLYVQFIEIEELSGNGGASGYVITSNGAGIKILGGFFGSRDVIRQTAKASGEGIVTFTERQATSACSYTEQVAQVNLFTESLMRTGASVLKSECSEML